MFSGPKRICNSILTAIAIVLFASIGLMAASAPQPSHSPSGYDKGASDYTVVWDTVYCDDGSKAHALALTVGNNGNIGHQGIGHVNLDYFDYGDCTWYDEDSEDNPYLGETRVYLYDGSPILCWMEGDEVVCDYSMYGRTPETGGFIPGETPPQEYPDWMTPQGEVDADLHVALYFNRDSTIRIEQVTIAPNIENPTFMIQAHRYTNITDADITGLAIGEALDWDIPTDSFLWNGDARNWSQRLMCQRGEEYGQDVVECTRNDARAGGLALFDIYEDGVWIADFPGMYTMDNATQVYPLGEFDPDSLWQHMQSTSGYTRADSSQKNDLHMVATYRRDHTLAANGGNLIVYTMKATSYDGGLSDISNSVARASIWYMDNFKYETCCHFVGDINHDGEAGGVPMIDDLVYLVTYMFQNGHCEAMCETTGIEDCRRWELQPNFPETDVNGDGSPIPDIVDLVYLVTYMFNGPYPVGWIDANTPACIK